MSARTHHAASPEHGARASTIARLREQLGERLSTASGQLAQHGGGEGVEDKALPDAVVFAESTDDVRTVLVACNAAGVPVVPFGAGTSLEGHLNAVHGGISLDLTRMNRVLSVNAEDLDCRVEAGVSREQLNQYLRDLGLFFPLDPGANATLGGMAATRASGTNAVRYGTMRDVTLGLTVVTPDGTVIRTGGRARKSSAGYDLTRLYIGSEGTLGVITELQLRVFGVPERIVAATCQFPSVEAAVAAVTTTLQLGLPVARIELLDALQMSACIAYSKLVGLQELPTLFLEFHGSPAAVDEHVGMVRELCADNGGTAFAFAADESARQKLWKARHDAFWAARQLAPGKHSFATDACVPISELGACIAETRAEADASGLICPIVGHVGDGNFHVLVLFDPDDPGERARADALSASIARRALAHGGTCTGEHGIGLHKLDMMPLEHGPALDVMRAIKQALDPKGIMNPGKTIPA